MDSAGEKSIVNSSDVKPTRIQNLHQRDLATIFKDISYFDLIKLCEDNFLIQEICDNETFWEYYFNENYKNVKLSSRKDLTWQQKVKIMCCSNMGPITITNIRRLVDQQKTFLTKLESKNYDDIYIDIKRSSLGLLVLSEKKNAFLIPLYDLNNIKYTNNIISSDRLTYHSIDVNKLSIEEKIIKIEILDFNHSELKSIHFFLSDNNELIQRQYIYSERKNRMRINEFISVLEDHIHNIIAHNNRLYLFGKTDVHLLEVDFEDRNRKSFVFEVEIIDNIPRNTVNIWSRGDLGFFYLADDTLYFAKYRHKKYISKTVIVGKFEADKIWIIDSLLYIYSNNKLSKFLIMDTYDRNFIELHLSREYFGTKILTVYSQREFPYYFILDAEGKWINEDYPDQVRKYSQFFNTYTNGIVFYPEIMYDLETVIVTKYSSI